MGNRTDSRFSDFTDKEVIKRRAKKSLERGDSYDKRILEIVDRSGKTKRIKFRENFNVFADDVAHELREKIVYRSDGGKFARGLVRANGQLEIVHNLYKALEYKNGQEIKLLLFIVRRKDVRPPYRWTMDILFKVLDFEDFRGEGPTITEIPGNVTNMRCKRLDELFNSLESALPKLAPTARKQILGMIEVAERVGCHKSRKLWYYNRHVMKDYIHWRTTDKERALMTAGTTFRMPFDGHTWQRGAWRLYPFRELLLEFPSGSLDGKEMRVAGVLEHYRVEIVEGLRDINRELESTASMRNAVKLPFTDNETEIYGLATPFFGHMKKLRNNTNHLYSAF